MFDQNCTVLVEREIVQKESQAFGELQTKLVSSQELEHDRALKYCPFHLSMCVNDLESTRYFYS